MTSISAQYLFLDCYLRGDPKTRYDTLQNYLEIQALDEIGGPGGGSFKIHVDDKKLSADIGNLFKHRNVFKIRRSGKAIGAFILQSRDLTEVDSNEAGSKVWEVSGEGLRGWFRDAIVLPENGLLDTDTPDNRAFNFSCLNKSRWYDSSQWKTPTKLAKYKAPGSKFGTKPANWPDVPNANWIWSEGFSPAGTDHLPGGDNYFRCEWTAPKDGNYSFYFAGNNALDVYVDGQQIFSAWSSADNVDNTQSVTSQPLNAGSHVLAAKVINTQKGTRAGFIASIFQEGIAATGSAPAVPAKLLQYTGDASWKVCGYPTVAPGWTPGEILLRLLDEAKSRGVLFPNWLTPTFTENVDSAGVPWSRTDDFSWNVGTEYFDVLSSFEDVGGDIWIDPETYTLNFYGQRGSNKSGYDLTTFQQDTSQTNPVVLRIGKNLQAAESSITGAIKNSLVVRTGDGWFLRKSPVTADLGLIEGSFQTSTRTDRSASVATTALQKLSTPTASATYSVVPLTDLVPFTNFSTGDWVQAPGPDFVQTARRVMSITTTADADTGQAAYALEFEAIQADRITRLEHRLDKLMNTGSTVGSSLTSTTSVILGSTVGGPNGGVIPDPVAAPTNLVGKTTAGWTTAGNPTSQVVLTWNPSISPNDGSAQNVDFYEVWGGPASSVVAAIGKTSNTTFTALNLDLDVSYTFRVRARASDNASYSDFSNDLVIKTAIPTQQLDKPTPPTLVCKLGVVTVSWDGLLVATGGATHAADPRLSQVRLQMATKSDMSDATYVGQPLSAQGSAVVPYLTVNNTYYFRFLAVDTFGLVSGPSDVKSILVTGINYVDLDPIVGQQVQNGSTLLYQSATPTMDQQVPNITWYDTAHGYLPKRWNGSTWAPITYGLQDDGSGTAIYSFIQTGAIAANAINTFQIQAGAVTAEKIDVGAIQAQHISLGSYIPSGYGTDRVPGPLLDNVNWASTWDAKTRSTLNPENVTYTPQGVQLTSDASNRAIWAATPLTNVPASGKIIIDWIADSDYTELWIRQVTASDPFGWTRARDSDGSVYESAFGHVVWTFDSSVTKYGIYFDVAAGDGTSLIKAVSVNEMSTAYTNLENVQITQGGIFMYDASGQPTLSLSPVNKKFLSFNNTDDSGLTNSIALNQDGTGQFEEVSASIITGTDLVQIDADTYLKGDDNAGSAALVLGGTDLLGSLDDDEGGGTYFDYQGVPFLDRLARNVVYRGYWDAPGSDAQYTIHAQFQRFASGKFTLQPGRQYQFILNNGGLQIGGSDSATLTRNLYFDLMFELGSLSSVVNSGQRIMRSVVYVNGDGTYVHSPVTFAAVSGADLTATNLTQGIIPGGTPIAWQYGSALSALPTNVSQVPCFGTGQSLTVVDIGPAFTNFFTPTNANDTTYTGQYNSGSGGGSSSGTGGGATTKKVTKTKTVVASWSRSWNNNGSGIVSGSGVYTDANMMYQGLGASAMGSMVGFPALNLPNGATVSKVQLYLKNRHFYWNAGGHAIIGHHSNSSAPSTWTGSGAVNYNWGYGQGKWVTLPSSWNNNFAGDDYRGITLGKSGANADYAYFDGNGKSAEPQLKVTYTYTTTS